MFVINTSYFDFKSHLLYLQSQQKNCYITKFKNKIKEYIKKNVFLPREKLI